MNAFWCLLLLVIFAAYPAEIIANSCESRFKSANTPGRYKYALELIDSFDFARVFDGITLISSPNDLHVDLRAQFELTNIQARSRFDFKLLYEALTKTNKDFMGFEALTYTLIKYWERWAYPLELQLKFRYFRFLHHMLNIDPIEGAGRLKGRERGNAANEFRQIVVDAAAENAMALISLSLDSIANRQGNAGPELSNLAYVYSEFNLPNEIDYSAEMLTILASYLLGYFDAPGKDHVKASVWVKLFYVRKSLLLLSLQRPLIIGQNQVDLTPYLFGMMVRLSHVARGRVRLIRMLQSQNADPSLRIELERFIYSVAVPGHPRRMLSYLELLKDEYGVLGGYGKNALETFLTKFPLTANDALAATQSIANGEISLSPALIDLIEAHWDSSDVDTSTLLEQLMTGQDTLKAELGAKLFVKSLRSKFFASNLTPENTKQIITNYPNALRDRTFVNLTLTSLKLEEIPDFLRTSQDNLQELRRALGIHWQTRELSDIEACTRNWTNAELEVIEGLIDPNHTNTGLVELYHILQSCDPNIAPDRQISIVDRAATYASSNLPQYALKNLTKNVGVKGILQSLNESEITGTRFRALLHVVAKMPAETTLAFIVDLLQMHHLFTPVDAQNIAGALNKAATVARIWPGLAASIVPDRKSDLDFTIASLIYLSVEASDLGLRNESLKQLAIQARSDGHIFGSLVSFKSDRRREQENPTLQTAIQSKTTQEVLYYHLKSLMSDHKYENAKSLLLEHPVIVNMLSTREIVFFTRVEYNGDNFRQAKYSAFSLRLMKSLSLTQIRSLVASQQKHAYMFATMALLWRARCGQDSGSEYGIGLLLQILSEGLRLGAERGAFYRGNLREVFNKTLSTLAYKLTPAQFELVFTLYKADEENKSYKDKIERLTVLSIMQYALPDQRKRLIDLCKELISYEGAPEPLVVKRWHAWRRLLDDKFYTMHKGLIESIVADFFDPTLNNEDFAQMLQRIGVHRHDHFGFYSIKSLAELKAYARSKAQLIVAQRSLLKDEDGEDFRGEMEEVSIVTVIISELERGHIPFEVDGDRNLGYDVLSIDPANGVRRLIEVKSKFSDGQMIWTSSSQVRANLKAKISDTDDFYFYVVNIDDVDKDEALAITKYRSPDFRIYGIADLRNDEHWRMQVSMTKLRPYLHSEPM